MRRHYPLLILLASCHAAPSDTPRVSPDAYGVPATASYALGPLLQLGEPPLAQLKIQTSALFRLVRISMSGEDLIVRFQQDTSGAWVSVKRFSRTVDGQRFRLRRSSRTSVPQDRLDYLAEAFSTMAFYTYTPEANCDIDGEAYLLEASSPVGSRTLEGSSCARTSHVLAELLVNEAGKYVRLY